MRGPGPKKMESVSRQDLKKTYAQLASSMKKYYPQLIGALIAIIGSVVLAVYSPQVLKELTDYLVDIQPNNAANDTILESIDRLGIELIIFYFCSAILNYICSFLMATVAQRYTQELRTQIEEKINSVPLRYFDTTSTGDLLSTLTNDVDQIATSLQQSVSMIVNSVLTILAAIIAMFVTCWQMALVTLAILPIMVVILILILKLSRPQFTKRQNLLGEVDGLVEENYNGQLIIKVFNAEDRTKKDFDKKNDELQKSMFLAEVYGSLMQPMMSFFSYFSYAAVCVTGGLLISGSVAGITMGTITAFLQYVNLYQSPLSQIAQALNSLQSAGASGRRVFDFLAQEEIEDESDKAPKLLVDGKEKVQGSVSFEHVSFSYDGKREIIHDFSAEVKPGMKVAIVGPTGAGKTTMVNLLMRFYETGSGSIKIDGVDIKSMPRSEIHDIFAMVLQDTWVFDGTLRENLVYNSKNVTDEDIKNVIHDAHLTHFVRSLPGGLDYEITSGSQISGGQKQLITIARAMLKKAPLLILDEATSNVDTRTEEKIQEAMDRLTKGKTSFVIAHRLSTIKNADLILVMKDGNIIEQGTHESLMAQNGFYTSLYNSQFALEGENLIS